MTQTAKVYGGSLYDLAAEEKLTDVLLQQTREVCEIFRTNPEYLRLLAEPSIPLDERKGLIETAFGTQAERYLVNFIKLLCEKGLLGDFSGCCEEFARRYNLEHGIAEAVVTSAVALTESQVKALKSKLEGISGKKIILIQKVDASVVAGLRVELEGKQLDGTVQGRLAGISKRLNDVIV